MPSPVSYGRYSLRIIPFFVAALILAYTYRDFAHTTDRLRTKASNGFGQHHEADVNNIPIDPDPSHEYEVQSTTKTSGYTSIHSNHASSTSPSVQLVALTTPAIAYPTDYLPVYREDDECPKLFGRKYLEHMASHHVEYCEPESLSRFECFRTHRKEPFCVGRGVLLDMSRREGLHHTAMHCKMRNFTEEKVHTPALQDVMNLPDTGRGFYDTSVNCQLENWDINTKPENVVSGGDICDAEHNDGKWTLLVKRENHPNIWHRMLELWQSMIVLDVLKMAINPATKAPYLKESDIPNVQVIFTEYDAGTLMEVDDWWEMVTGNKPLMQKNLPPQCLGNVILPLEESSSPFWGYTWDEGDCHEPFLVNAFLRRLYRHLNIEQEYHVNKTGQTVVTIVDRKGTRKLRNQDNLIEKAQARWPQVKFQLVDFATTKLMDQVNIVRNTDVLLGLTGAGMTHMFWLPEESSVAEIQAPGAKYGGFRHLCKLRNLNYFTVFPEERPKDEMVTEGSDWQLGEWVDVKDDAFQMMVDAAINAQLHKGTRWSEVQHKEE